MRKLIWFTLGFGAACGVSAYFELPDILPLLFLAMAGIGSIPREQQFCKRFVIVSLGICAGLFWFSRFRNQYLNPVYELDGVTQVTEIQCKAYPETTSYGSKVEGSFRIGNLRYPVMVYLDGETATEPGICLSGPFRFQVTTRGGQKESSYFQGEGIFLLAYQDGEVAVSEIFRTWTDFPAILRQNFLALLRRFLPEDGLSFARALMLGDSSEMDYAAMTDLTVSGVRHIVAVSGLHVSILFGLLSFVTARNRIFSALLGIPVLVVFAAVTGFTPSVCRACLMCGLMLVATLVHREYDGPSALAFAGLVLLIINPLVITSVSYQLSFASVAGIFACSPGIRMWMQSHLRVSAGSRIRSRICNGLVLSVSVTLGATVATVPLCALYFGTVSLAAVLTNLLVLWAVSVIFYGILAMCLVGSVIPAGGAALGKMVCVLIRYVLQTAEIISDFPLASVYTKSPYIVAWLIFAYILLVAFLLSGNRKPEELIYGLIIGLCCAMLASWAEPGKDDLRFTVLDVGQGQCLLLQTDGKTFMVDCGGSSDAAAADAAAETLLSQGITKLDGVILTHYDKDHAGGMVNLLSRIEADLLILPPVYSDLNLQADQVLYAKEDIKLTAENMTMHIYTAGIAGSGNENSLCILLDTENCDILITGDRDGFGERMLLRRTALQDVDILVAGHHGAKDSTGEELLSAVQPEIVCISVGAENRFGHPAPELLQRLESYGCVVYRTDLHGDILIRR